MLLISCLRIRPFRSSESDGLFEDNAIIEKKQHYEMKFRDGRHQNYPYIFPDSKKLPACAQMKKVKQ